jgi:hypothetical protein
MLNKLIRFLYAQRDRQRILIGLAKGTAAMQSRHVDLCHPVSWEFSGFSQNGEDGILDVLRTQLRQPNWYFVEIGAADGIDNNSAWFAIVHKYKGLMIEGSAELVERAQRMVGHYSLGLEIVQMFVGRESAAAIRALTQTDQPDLFSLDIDGMDYYVADALLKTGFRPKIIVVEYNSAFGPEAAKTVAYADDFIYSAAHESGLYYGVSVTAWKKLFGAAGYRFVTVDRKGVNAFFVDPTQFDPEFLEGIQGTAFAENELQFRKFRCGHAEQFQRIAHLPFTEV